MENENQTLLSRFNNWRQNHISQRQFILALSLVVGVLTALAAILLKFLIQLVHGLLKDGLVIGDYNFGLLLFPVVGILLSGLFIRYFVRDDKSRQQDFLFPQCRHQSDVVYQKSAFLV